LAKKKVSRKREAPSKKRAAPKKKATPKKKAAPKKRAAPKKKAVSKKKAVPKKEAAPASRPIEPKPKPKPKRRGRITRMTIEEALISLSTLESAWSEFEWLQGLVLYGTTLKSADWHREFSFMVFTKGLRATAKLRAATNELDALVKTALPIKRKLHLLPDLSILDKIQRDDPAITAQFGHVIVVYAR